jgi:hypothetical protein
LGSVPGELGGADSGVGATSGGAVRGGGGASGGTTGESLIGTTMLGIGWASFCCARIIS